MPIPRELLIHNATHKYGTPAQDDDGNYDWPNTRTLSRVRFEPSSKLVMTKDNREVQLAALMFFDCHNSTPADTTFAVGDQIQQTGGATYEVVGVEPLYDISGLHHYEVLLV